MFFYRRNFFKQLGMLLTGGLSSKSPVAAGLPIENPATVTQQPVLQDDEFLKADYDLIVVGGGIAGTSTAISAARNGMRVALVHERSVLGGNSSSEVKLFPENNSGFHPWIKEGGIHEEFHTEERARKIGRASCRERG